MKTETPRYTFKEVVDSLPAEKRRADGTISKLLHRPLSFPLTLFFLKAGWSANAVTWLSIVCSVAALGLTLFPYGTFHYAAIGLYLLFGTLDCVDGNMARVLRARRQAVQADSSTAEASGVTTERAAAIGEWVDALGGYIAWTCILLSMGLSAVYFGRTIPLIAEHSLIWLGVAGIGSSANLLTRLVFQSWRVASGETGRGGVAGEKRFSEEIGITGWLQIVYLAGLVSGMVPAVLVLYTALFCAACVFTIFKMILKNAR